MLKARRFRGGSLIRRIVFGFALALWLAAYGQPAHAFVDPPLLVPANPTAGQTVSIDITAGVCDAFTSDPTAITRSGNSILMVLQSVSAPPASDFCIYPTGTYTFAVGTFDAGTYSLQVDRVYSGPNGPVTQTLGVLPFAVAGLVSSAALDPFSAITLALLLLVIAALTIRRRGRVAAPDRIV